MSLTIRFQRHGAKGAPVYRLVACEKSTRRDGRFVEILGMYNPKPRGQDKPHQLNLARIDHWLKVGAQPSDTARALIKLARKAALAAPAPTPAPAAVPAAEVVPAGDAVTV
jgi:small subunit ribosomal protein S16